MAKDTEIQIDIEEEAKTVFAAFSEFDEKAAKHEMLHFITLATAVFPEATSFTVNAALFKQHVKSMAFDFHKKTVEAICDFLQNSNCKILQQWIVQEVHTKGKNQILAFCKIGQNHFDMPASQMKIGKIE